MTSVHTEWILQFAQTFSGIFITWINDPTISLHKDSGPQVLISVPPVRRAWSRAASTQDAFIQAIQFGTILYGLQVLSFTLLFNSFISGEIFKLKFNKNMRFFSFKFYKPTCVATRVEWTYTVRRSYSYRVPNRVQHTYEAKDTLSTVSRCWYRFCWKRKGKLVLVLILMH